MEEQNRWALRTGEELEAARRDLTTVLENLTAAETTVVERTLWAQRLAAEVQDLGMQVEDLKARLNLWRASRWTKLGRKLNLGRISTNRQPRVTQAVAAARLRRFLAHSHGTPARNPFTAAAVARGGWFGPHRSVRSSVRRAAS